jgi:hypothetical protein
LIYYTHYMKEVSFKIARYSTLTIFVLGVCFSMFISKSHAALLYFDPLSADVYRGDTIALDLRIDTDAEECINTIDAVIHYDESIRAVDISTGESILNVWVESPVINEEAHTISFAGGIPGGYCGRIPGDPKLTNILITVLFRSPGLSIGTTKTPIARIELDASSQVLLHDGLGTVASLRTQNAELTLLDTPGTAQSDAWRDEIQSDTEPPSDFQITLTRDETAFSGDYFIVFNALDKQSGIDHYEIFEEPFEDFSLFKWGRADTPWQPTESPHVLKDQSLGSTIWVKAIDKAGNERVVKFVPDNALNKNSQNTRLIITIAGAAVFLIVGLFTYVLWRKKQNHITEEDNDIHIT